MNELLAMINEGLENYNTLSDDNKAIAEITFNKVTGVLAADITADYSDNDITALIQAVGAVNTVTAEVEKKATFIAFKHYYPDFKKNGTVKVGEKTANNLQSLAKLCGVTKSPKQRGSSYKAIIESSLDLEKFKDCTIGRLAAFADAISKGIPVEQITPDLTPAMLDNMVKMLNVIDTDTDTGGTVNATEKAEDTNITEDTENATEGTENATEGMARGAIQIDTKNSCIRITNATIEEVKTFLDSISGDRSPAKHLNGVLEYTKM